MVNEECFGCRRKSYDEVKNSECNSKINVYSNVMRYDFDEAERMKERRRENERYIFDKREGETESLMRESDKEN